MLRKIGIALVLIGIVAIGIRALVVALTSDETKVRWAIQDAAHGFDEARMNPVLTVLAREFRDETTGFTREDLRGALAGAFFGEKDPVTKEFAYRCEIQDEAIQVTVTPGKPAHATVSFPAKIIDTRGGSRRDAWSFQVEGQMEERADGWCFVSTTHATTDGSFRLR